MSSTTTAAAEMESGKAPERKTSSLKKCLIGLGVFCACAGGAAGGIAGGLLGGGALRKGTWLTNWGTYITVTDTHWYAVSSWGTGVQTIVSLSNEVAILQNPSTDAYNPDKYVKNEMHSTEDGWAYCSSVYDADTAAAARNTDTSDIYDATDDTAGCNGFGHTTVTAFAMPIAGSWTTNWGATLTISDTEWKSVSDYGTSTYKVEAWGANFVLMQNPADDEYNPSKWTKVEFHEVGDDIGFCMSVYDGATATAALTTDTSSIYDATDAAAGCNGFGHTVASPA